MKIGSNDGLKLVVGLLACATCSLAQTPGYYNGPPAQPGMAQPGAPQSGAPQPGFAGPGSLNYLEGQVSSNGQALTRQAIGHFTLQPGQTLATGTGHAEILLTPGVFLRVGTNSEFRMVSVGLADVRLTLTQGSLLVEADQVIPGSHVEVTIGSTSVDLLEKGLYGFNANPPAVRSFTGKAEVVGLNKSREIGKHNEILLAGNDTLKKTSFDENQAKRDDLYVWSEARSREEAAQNKLVAQNANGYAPVGEGWFWDPYVGYYGFWPPAYFYSPFGFGFYGGFYPGFYGGFRGGYRGGFLGGIRGGYRGGFSGVHGNGVGGGFHGGGGGFHGGGGRR